VRIVVHEGIRTDPELIRAFVLEGFRGIDADGVEVHVEPCGSPARSFAGRAYVSVPRRASAGAGARYLVRLFLPTTLRPRGFPRTYRYRRLRTAPPITVRDWREALVALAAHEACHVRQFREGLRRSELAAERWSKSVLESWIAERDRPAVPVVPTFVPLQRRAAEQLAFELAVWPSRG
jgi:hypothetical protein